MIGRILGDRLREYAPSNALEQENQLAELLQCFILASLSRARFFSEASFHGGTCLRILYGMNRFSEDLDFLARGPNPGFDWAPYLDRIRADCRDEGLDLEVHAASGAKLAVRKAHLKTDPIGGIDGLRLPIPLYAAKKIRIKLEVDTNPPMGSVFETRYLSFPLAAAVTTQTLESGFATKAHALLCRGFTKGRDWYDFLWYVSRRTVPLYNLLANALHQQGPWAGSDLTVTHAWFLAAMRERIGEIDWEAARKDVSRFIVASEQETLSLWSRDFFLYHLERFSEYAGSD
jgi:hypothetical protein